MAQLLELIVSGGNCTVTNDGVITANSYKKSGYDDNYFLLAGGGVKSISQFLTNSTLYEAYLQWGGTNMADLFGPVDAALEPSLGANRLAFANADGITIEYSSDNGVTWQTHPADDIVKTGLTSSGTNIYLCGNDSQATASYRLRIIFNTSVCKIYTSLIKFIIYVTTNGSKDCRVSIYKALESTPDDYISIAENVKISGWSGYNVINVQPFTTYNGSTSTATYRYGRIKFEFSGGDCIDNYTGLRILRIMGYGGVGWDTPSTMASTGHLYSYDYLQKATFPNTICVNTGGFVMSSNSSADNLLTSNGSFITKTNLLSGYATQSWVNSQGFLKYYVNTWRPIQLEGKEVITNATNTSLNFSAGTNVTITSSSNNIVISSSYINTTNTAGSTNSASKLYLIGATSQTSSSTTYSKSTCYIGADSCLYSNNDKVLTSNQSLSTYLLITGTNATNSGTCTILGKLSSSTNATSKSDYAIIRSSDSTTNFAIRQLSNVGSGYLYDYSYPSTTTDANNIYVSTTWGVIPTSFLNYVDTAHSKNIRLIYADDKNNIAFNTEHYVSGISFGAANFRNCILFNGYPESSVDISFAAGCITFSGAIDSSHPFKRADFRLTPNTTYDFNAASCTITSSGITATAFYQTSDSRKKNIISLLDENRCSDFINNINFVEFTFKDDKDKNKHIGVVAQDVEEYFPELVISNKDGFKSVDYSKLGVIAIQEIKELKKEIKELRELLNK